MFSVACLGAVAPTSVVAANSARAQLRILFRFINRGFLLRFEAYSDSDPRILSNWFAAWPTFAGVGALSLLFAACNAALNAASYLA